MGRNCGWAANDGVLICNQVQCTAHCAHNGGSSLENWGRYVPQHNYRFFASSLAITHEASQSSTDINTPAGI